MGTPIKTSEITELNDEGSLIHRSKAPCLVPSKANSHEAAGKKHVHPVESDLIELLEAHDSRNLSKITATHPKGIDLLRKNALKKPLKMSAAQASGLVISETMSLKQALRKLCISHASDMAAMKRLSKPIGVSVSSEAGTIKRLYASVVVQSSESDSKGHEKLLEISVQEKKSSKSSEKLIEPSKKPSGLLTSNNISESSSHDAMSTAVKVVKPRIRDVLSSTTDESARRLPMRLGTQKKEKLKSESFISLTKSSDSCKSDVSPRPVKPAVKNKSTSVKKGNCDHTSESFTSLTKTSDSYKSDVSPRLVKQPVKNKGALSKKENSAYGKKGNCAHTSESCTSLTKSCDSCKSDASPRLGKQAMKSKGALSKKENSDTSAPGSCVQNSCVEKVVKGSVRTKTSRKEEPVSSSSSAANINTVPKSMEKNLPETKTDSAVSNIGGANGMKRREFSRSKGECSQSSKSSIGDYSSSTSISDDSNQSGASGIGIRPHMSNDVRWAAIRHVETTDRNIGLRNFKLLKRLGCGDIGTVYLAELTGLGCLFALKVMDNDFLISRKKMMRAQTEREILQMLDHPFLPTLYTHFTTDNLSCLVMEYCPGGDLHVLRQKQLGRSFSEPAARFYVAEVLLALEYLHMLGVVYRDLKPENILVREDGHIMLSDFDLSLRCTVNPSLVRLSSVGKVETAGRVSGVCSESYCIDPLCLQPSWAQVSCFTPRLGSSTTVKTRKHKSDLSTQVRPLPQLVVEPTDARSNSFVGTHEYLAPEIIKGEGHGSSVDWWTFGIFLYELLFGRTPFKGPNNEETLANVVSHSLKFPENPVVSFHARDLIRGLLVKEPENRLGSVKGAAEIKQHPFFAGLNWALIRCATPPEVPQPYDFGIQLVEPQKKSESKFMEVNTEAEGVEFELF